MPLGNASVACGRRTGSDVPRTEYDPQWHHGRSPGAGICAWLRNSAGRGGGILQQLLDRVQVTSHMGCPAIAPRITVRMRNGATYQDEFKGNELEWDLATEI